MARLFLCIVLSIVGAGALRGAAPTVVSVSPTNGATQVPTTSPLVFVFDQAMDTNTILVQSSAGFTGNFEVTAPGANLFFTAFWGSDEKTMTIEPAIQYPFATMTWTLNPAGSLSFLRIKSKAGEELATVTGSFATGVGGEDPSLGSSVPVNGAVNVATNVQVTFRLDQAMKTNVNFSGIPGPVSWTGEGIDPARFVYSWSADKKNLYADYTGGLPVNTMVAWALNPAGAAVKLEGENGKFLASGTYFGQFTTGNGETNCLLTGFPENWGSYGVSKRSDFRQTSSADPVPDTNEAAFFFSAFVNPPAASGVSAGSITRPNNSVDALTTFAGIGQFFETAASEAALNTAFPSGSYVLRFTLTGQSEQVINMSMPAELPPVPKITNFEEAQSINARADFTIRWNGFAGAGPNDHQSIYISDTNGNVVFQAPNLCVPRELPVTATSIVIPANTLRTNQTYSAGLLYGDLFYFSTNAVPQMFGFGDLVRTTLFTMKTGNGGGGPSPEAGRFTSFTILPNGNPQLTFTGTIGRVYTIERAGQLTPQSWQQVGTATIGASGSATFEDTESGKVFPLFYRLSSH